MKMDDVSEITSPEFYLKKKIRNNVTHIQIHVKVGLESYIFLGKAALLPRECGRKKLSLFKSLLSPITITLI